MKPRKYSLSGQCISTRAHTIYSIMWSWLLVVSIDPHLQSLLSDIFFHIMGFSPSPEIHEPSLSNTKVKGHFYRQNNNIENKKRRSPRTNLQLSFWLLLPSPLLYWRSLLHCFLFFLLMNGSAPTRLPKIGTNLIPLWEKRDGQYGHSIAFLILVLNSKNASSLKWREYLL